MNEYTALYAIRDALALLDDVDDVVVDGAELVVTLVDRKGHKHDFVVQVHGADREHEQMEEQPE